MKGVGVAWMKLEAGARDHPKIIKLARDCNVTVPYALGMMVSLWLWTVEHAPDGDLSSYDAEDIELAAGWTGEVGKWYKAAVARRLLDEVDGYAHIHDWQEYTSSWTEAERAREWRKSKGDRTAQSRTRTAQSRTRTAQLQHGAPDRPSDRPSDRPLLVAAEGNGQPEDQPATPPTPKSFSPESNAYRLAKLLFDLIRARRPTFKPKFSEVDLQRWAKDLDLALRADGRLVSDLERVIRFAQADVVPRGAGRFCWAKNILSGDAVRRGFDRLMEDAGDALSGPDQDANFTRDVRMPTDEELRAALGGEDGNE